MAAPVQLLEVHLHGRLVGTLTRLAGDQILFAFTEEYAADPVRPTLSLSFKDRLGGLLTAVRPTRTRAPPFFANLLPEGPLRDYLARRANVHRERDFFLLGALGEDLPGAVTVVPPADGTVPLPGSAGIESAGNERGPYAHALRFSLAGVQLKFSAVMDAAGGLTIPVSGVGGAWIVKLPSAVFRGVPENEFTMMSLARAAGLAVPEVRLVDVAEIAGLPPEMQAAGGRALAVRRFDRTAAGERVHVEDFAQVFRVYPDDKYVKASYRNIAEVIWAEVGEEGIAEFIRRLAFNALIGNADMHLKNWSLFYPDGRTAALAPGYDFVATLAFIDDPNLALTLGRTKHMHALTEEEFARLAGKAGLPEKLVMDAMRETCDRFFDLWPREIRHLPLPKAAIAILEKHFSSVPFASRGSSKRSRDK